MSRRRGFSLLELLVGMAVVIVIASIVYVIGAPAKKRAYEGVCASHLSSLHQALMLYRVDYGGADYVVGDVPRLGLPPGWSNPDAPTIEPRFGTIDMWRCPAPKLKENYLPQYYFLVFPPDSPYPNSFEENTARYRDELPILLDPNHNDPLRVNIYFPRIKKRIIFIDMAGRLTSKTVTRAYRGSWYIPFFELKIDEGVNDHEEYD